MTDDMEWGMSQWDVDSNAESLHKSLFGKKRTDVHKVKADLDVSDRNGAAFGADSDDDDKLSRKAKKKLKERKRKENKRNKKKTDENGQTSDAEAENDEEDRSNVKTKSKKTKVNDSVKKTKSKSSDAKLPRKTKDSDKASTGSQEPTDGADGEKEGKRKRKRKRKNSQSDDKDEKIKEKKIENENSDANADGEGQPKAKRKRQKKKKPNSKKNKYKHLGLKSKSVNQEIVNSDDEENEDKDTVRGTDGKQNVTSNNLEKSKKRKNSISAETLPAKKIKLRDDSDPGDVVVKTKKGKKSKAVEEVNGVEEDMDIDQEKEVKKSKKLKKDKTTNSVGEKGKPEIGNKVKNKSGKESSNNSTPKVIDDHNLQTKKNDSKKLKKEKNMKEQNASKDDTSKKEGLKHAVKTATESSQPSKSSSPFFTSTQGSELQQRMVEKLASARFRFINEQMYTIKGGEAFRMFQQDNTLMDAYNIGFQGQAKQWSVNPLDVIIKQLSTKPAHLAVVDFGCGEARLSASVPQKVNSIDLYALNERVTVCDMSKTPLASNSMDVAVFCLSLMGTNLNDYLLEANRVLKDGGLLKVAEVVSRFTKPEIFIKAVSSLGFKSVNTRDLSAMFYLMDFKKVKRVEKSSKQIKTVSLKACLYKKR